MLGVRHAANVIQKCYAGKRKEYSDMESSINQDELKDLIKAALIEVLEERQDLIHEAIAQALEDLALARAIEEGESSELIRREEVFDLLEDRA
jgi:hypothetical protein